MAAFSATVPVITLGSTSKRWIIPGWRLGWLVTCDPTAALKNSGLIERITECLEVTPDPATFMQVKLNLELLDDIGDDMEFCFKLAEEESVVVLPGVAVGMKNWLRVTFACDHSCLEDGLGRMKAFYQRHAKKH